MRNYLLLLVVLIVGNSCTSETKIAKTFIKIPSQASGIFFENRIDNSTDLNILTYLYYYNGAGVAAADFNNDGLIDLYFTANQSDDKLFLNSGKLRFKDVTSASGLKHFGSWSTGVTHIDINNDGLLDIYVCKVSNYKKFVGHNLLFVNQGNDSAGIPKFKEESQKYGLDFSGLSTQASFFDYDLDGDLDVYLMNHSVHPNRSYGKGELRKLTDTISGDRLYKNQNGHFIDASKEAKIYQGKIGYGLGLATSDLNNDGYPDIYIGNDFYENDYLYINQQDGTFKEIISAKNENLGHTTHYSMGNDLADINNDGLIDILSLDMLPKDLKTYKTSGQEFAFTNYQWYLRNGYHPQYMQNTLHLNLGNQNFSEIAHSSGLAATEWSWGALIADFDNDSYKDVYISTGIKGATNNMDYINFLADENIQRSIDRGVTDEIMGYIKKLPKKQTENYLFKNNGNLTFTNVTNSWYQPEDSFSNGCTYADLDNDGDLDLVVNNIDDYAYLMENKTNENETAHYLKIKFNGAEKNRFGIGAKLTAYLKNKVIVTENFATRSYLSAVPPEVLIGIGKDSIIDSLLIEWPNQKFQVLKNIISNKTLMVAEANANPSSKSKRTTHSKSYLENAEDTLNYVHSEEATVEFDRNPLLPYANSNEGPDISVADINNDGFDDIFLGGAKNQPASLLLQTHKGEFESSQTNLFEKNKKSENTSHAFFDVDGDDSKDLIVVSGGNEYKTGRELQPILYRNKAGMFFKDSLQFNGVEVNASKVMAVDIDNDNDNDIVISADLIPHEYGATPVQFIFKNDGNGNYVDCTENFAKEFRKIGNVKDFVWIDLDDNGFKDLIVVGHWIPLTIFMNNGTELRQKHKNGLAKTNGWWNTIEAGDFDNDGDIDFVAGNLGTNTMLKAEQKKPIRLYRKDFDDNGKVETIITYFHKETETTLANKDELTKQLPFLNKEYLTYSKFADASLVDLFSKPALENALKKEVYTLKSSYFENNGENNFTVTPLPNITQTTIIHDLESRDFNNDGFLDILLVGNSYEINTQLGRLDASHGLIMLNDTKGGFIWKRNEEFNISGPARSVKKINVKNEEYYLVTINNGAPVFLKINTN